MDTQRPEKSNVSINQQLLLFAPTTFNSGVIQTKWIDCNPLNALTDDGDVLLSISGSGSSYIDLSRTMLYVKAKIVKANGDSIEASDKVAPVNLFLHSLFSQIDVDFQQRQVSSTGSTYPYQSIINVLLSQSSDAKLSYLQSALYFKDSSVGMNVSNPEPASSLSDLKDQGNKGLQQRYLYAKNSAEIDMIGVPFLDIFEIDKYLINGVDVRLRLVQSKNSFRLMSSTSSTNNYKVILTHVSLRVCRLYLDPSMISTHAESIQDNNVIYSFMQNNVKTFAIAKGSYIIKLDDLYQGKIPSKLICAMVKSDAFSGSYTENPFYFQSCDIDSFHCYANSQALPFNGITTKFSKDNYQEAYNMLFNYTDSKHLNRGINITRDDFKKGYTLFVFDLDAHVRSSDALPALKSGNLSLEVRLATALPWAGTLICYGKFPTQVQIDKSRSIIL